MSKLFLRVFIMTTTTIIPRKETHEYRLKLSLRGYRIYTEDAWKRLAIYMMDLQLVHHKQYWSIGIVYLTPRRSWLICSPWLNRPQDLTWATTMSEMFWTCDIGNQLRKACKVVQNFRHNYVLHTSLDTLREDSPYPRIKSIHTVEPSPISLCKIFVTNKNTF